MNQPARVHAVRHARTRSTNVSMPARGQGRNFAPERGPYLRPVSSKQCGMCRRYRCSARKWMYRVWREGSADPMSPSMMRDNNCPNLTSAVTPGRTVQATPRTTAMLAVVVRNPVR